MPLSLDDLPSPKNEGQLSIDDLPAPNKTSAIEAGVRGAIDFATFGLDKYAEGLARTAYKAVKGEEDFNLKNIGAESNEAEKRSDTAFNEHKAAYRTGEVVAGTAMLAKTLLSGVVRGAAALGGKALESAGVSGAGAAGDVVEAGQAALKAAPGAAFDAVKGGASKAVDLMKGTLKGTHGPIRNVVQDFLPNASEKQLQRVSQAAAAFLAHKAVGGDSDHSSLTKHLIDAIGE